MALPSFAFGAGFSAKTPKEAARQRAVYEQLAARGGAPQNVGEGLNRVGEALLARSMLDRATAGEEAGQARVAELVAGLGDGADQAELMAAMSDPWVAENPAGSMIAQTMLQRELQKGDPLYQIGLEKSQLELDALRNPMAKPPEIETIYDPVTGTEKKVQWDGATGGWIDVGGTKAPSNGLSVTTNPDGTVSVVQGGKALTEGQSKDTVYSTRATGTLPILDKLGDALTDLGGNLAGNAGMWGNFVKTPEYQQAEQAGKEFLQAILRKDTGAAITAEETAEYGSVYLPRPGDSPEVLEQKRASRIRAVEAIEAGLPPNAIVARDRALMETQKAAAGSAGQEIVITTDEEYDALPSGTTFKAPDGTLRRKP